MVPMVLEQRQVQQQYYTGQDAFLSSGNDDGTPIWTGYTSSQDAFLRTAPRITAILSLMGTGWIILEVFYYSSNKRFYVYHKLVSAMAFYCFWNSLWYFVSDWAVLNQTSCRTQGFFLQLAVGPAIYYCMLFLYYMLVICYSYSEQRLRYGWETIFHLVPLVVSIVTSSVCVPWDLYNPSLPAEFGYPFTAEQNDGRDVPRSPWCWIAPDPEELWGGAGSGSGGGGETAMLDRIAAYQWGFYLGPAWLSYGCTIAALIAVFRGVQAQEERMKKYVTTSTIRRVHTNTGGGGPTTTITSNSVITTSSEVVGAQSSLTGGGVPSLHRRYPQWEDESTSRNQDDHSSSHPPDDDYGGDSASGGGPDVQQGITSVTAMQGSSLLQQNNNYMICGINPRNDSAMSLPSSEQTPAASLPSYPSRPSLDGNPNHKITFGRRLQHRFVSLIRYDQMREYWEHRPRTRQVVVQAMCYVGAFFWTNIFLTINQLIVWQRQWQELDHPVSGYGYHLPYALVALQVMFQPLQGFFIFLAYRRPTYVRMRRKGLSRWKSLVTSLEWNSSPVDPPAGRGGTGPTTRLVAGAGNGRNSSSHVGKPRKKKRAPLTAEEKEERRRRRKEEWIEKKRIQRERMEQQQQQRLQQSQNQRKRRPRPLERRKSEPIDLSSTKGIHRHDTRKYHRWTKRQSSFLRFLGIPVAEDDGANVDDNDDKVPSQSLHDIKRARLETLEEKLQRSQSAPFPLTFADDDGMGDDDIMDGNDDENNTNTGDGNAPMRNFTEKGHDSFSTANTRRTSGLTKEGSSWKFELLQKEDSMKLTDLLQESVNDEENGNVVDDDDGSFSLEEMVSGSAEGDGDDVENDNDEDETESGDADERKRTEPLHDSVIRRLGFGFFGRRELRKEFQTMKQHSDRYKDLVCMDIIPEADGAIEEKWRAIETRAGRYKKTKHEKQRMNMSLPVLSERELPVYPPLPPAPNSTKHGPQPSPKDAGKSSASSNPRHGWSKLSANPLFKVSGRWKMDSPSPTVQDRKKTPSDNTRATAEDAPTSTRSVPRTSSGGYFYGSMEKSAKESAFLDKLELEKKRKEILKAISSRRVSETNPDADGGQSLMSNDDADVQVAERPSTDQLDSKEEARKSLEDARKNLERSIWTASRNRLTLDPDCDSEDFDVEVGRGGEQRSVEHDDEGDPATSGNNPSRWPSLGMERARREIMDTMNRLSNRCLDHIPEASEHSETKLSDSSHHDDPPVLPSQRYGSDEFSLIEMMDGSNEMTIRSSGSSKRTIKQSNRRTADDIIGDRRRSSVSGMSSEEVSMVSDTPLSEDEGFLSDSDADSIDPRDVTSEDHDKAKRRGSGSGGKAGDKKLRESFSELQRLSERSLEDLGESSNSFHIDTGDMLLETSTNTEHA